ncbi:endo-1,4-B-xylanase A [Mycena olivaceomarginata]|nr:endo-1,4-B-xylanase A [Mycena olivaceomarginata]
MLSIPVSLVLALLPSAIALAPIWGQCGGRGFTGPTVCSAGSVCYYENPFFSNCYPTTTSTAKANTVAKSAAGKLYFGSATDVHELNDTAYIALLSDNTLFGQITLINSTTWIATESAPGKFDFTNGDIVAALAKKNGQLLRGQSCVGIDQLPGWVTAGIFSAAELQSILQTHCSTVVKHYAGQVYLTINIDAWDVVNEPFNDDGTVRSFVFPDSLGISYITTALVAARAADPTAKLYINEYNIESAGNKSTAMINLVKSLKDAGTPIDSIGIQGHFTVAEVPSVDALIANFEAFTLGQQSDYQTVISACKAVAGCVGVTLWDYTDKYSWLQPTDTQSSFGTIISGSAAACPWDENLVPKVAYDGIIAGFTN